MGVVSKVRLCFEHIQCNVRSHIIQCRRGVEEGDSDGIRFSGGSSSEHF